MGDGWRWGRFAALLDVAVVALAYLAALALRFDWRIPDPYQPTGPFLYLLLVAILLHVGANALGGVYSVVPHYVGLPDALRVSWLAVSVALALTVGVVLLPLDGARVAPLSVVIMGGLLSMVGLVGLRFWRRIVSHTFQGRPEGGHRLLVVGAGQAAELVLREIMASPAPRYDVVGLVDDNRRLKGLTLHNRRVLGTATDIPRLSIEQDVDEILIAVPSATPEQLRRILRIARPTGLPVKALPSLKDLVDGNVSLLDARELRIEDLLGRPMVEIDLGAITRYLHKKRVMITGAAGSIGAELARQVVSLGPAELVLVDKDESGLYYLHEELRKLGANRYLLRPTSVTLPHKMEHVFRDFRPEVVFHAAAFKHVPLMELNPDEAVVTNVKGTYTVGDLAGRYGAERVINISTDKAVDPVNVMGATKRAGELVMSYLGERYPDTRYTSVRFGNVLGSQGSVIPIFRSQIEAGGPVTITHPEMTRFFMMISEAVQLVLQAGALQDEVRLGCLVPYQPVPADGHSLTEANGASGNGAGGSKAYADSNGHHAIRDGYCQGVFVLDMGRPIRIIDLAHQMIDLLADPAQTVPVRITGLRPGEKLHEELFSSDETTLRTSHPLINFAYTNNAAADGNGATGEANRDCFESRVQQLILLAERAADPSGVITALQELIPEYRPFDLQSGAQTFPGVEQAVQHRTT